MSGTLVGPGDKAGKRNRLCPCAAYTLQKRP